MAAITYLHIRGTLDENMVYRPRPGFESEQAGSNLEGNPEFKVALLDGEDRVLVEIAPAIAAVGCGSEEDPIRYRLRGRLPLHPNGVAYELWCGQVRFHREAIPAEPPRLDACRCEKNDYGFALEWKPVPYFRPVTYSVIAKMASGRRITLARRLPDPHFEMDLRKIRAEGAGRIVVMASDGVRSSEVDGEEFELDPRGPELYIVSPGQNARVPYGQPLSAIGACHTYGELYQAANLVWMLDGYSFAEGTLIASIDAAKPGEHELKLVYRAGETNVEASTAFSVDEPDEDYRQWVAVMRQTG